MRYQMQLAHSRMTRERLAELLVYEPETGVLRWKVSVGGRGAKNGKGKYPAGSVAGCTDSHGYVAIRVDGDLHRAHRLAWLLMTGSWPKNDIDHINGDRKCNVWTNLRDVDRKANLQNSLRCRGAKSGYRGVEVKTGRTTRYAARIQDGSNRVSVGTFDTPEEASSAYLAAKVILHPGFATAIERIEEAA